MVGLRGLHGLSCLRWASRVHDFCLNLSILRANAVKTEEIVFPLEPLTNSPTY
jgi:hypothetical protein